MNGVPDATLLALDRTRLALERTTMAWIRTAASLISFGFSVYKFFNIESRRAELAEHLIGPREFGMLMISLGLLGLAIGSLQHWHSMRGMRSRYPDVRFPRSLAVGIGVLMSGLGVAALLAVVFRQ